MKQEKINTKMLPRKYQYKCSQCDSVEESNVYLDSLHREFYLCLQCSNKKKLERQEETIKSILPPKYLTTTFRNQLLIENYFEKSIFITGKSGVGKTVLMADLLKKYIKNDYNAKWISYPRFIMELQSLFRNNNDDPFAFAKNIADYPGVLFIDDLGAEKITDFVRQITYFILNEREQNNSLICITSNYSLQQIDELIDTRISSRIAGMCVSLKITGEDKRIKK